MIATFPTIYDDELVYSLLCRFYDHSGILSFRYAAESLFLNKLSRPTIEFVNAYTDDALAHLLRKCSMESFEKNHVAPPPSQDEALSRYSASGEVPR